MSYTVRPVQPQDFDGIADLLRTRLNHKFTNERWKQLFDYDWAPERLDLGYVAIDDEGVLAFLASTYSPIDPLTTNLSAWCVDARGRGKGVGHSLFNDYFSRSGVRYTALTGASYLTEAYMRMGFRPYETHRYVGGIVEDKSLEPVQATHGNEIQEKSLSAIEARIFRDHQPHRCRFALLEANGETCFVVMKDFARKTVGVFSEILYAGNLEFLVRYPAAISQALPVDQNSYVAIDQRFLPAAPKHTSVEELSAPRLVWTKGDYDPKSLNALYSEVVLLDVKM